MTPLSELAQGQQFPAGALYIVATPIGNVADITVRALHVLGLVDRVAAEDTRNTSQLLSRYGISKPTIAVHEHNERSAAEHVIAHLRNGERIACVSDAGTPGISDPGAKLVDAVREAGFPVIPLPGASALTTALSVAGAWVSRYQTEAARHAIAVAAHAYAGACYLRSTASDCGNGAGACPCVRWRAATADCS
jgi:16S rRNA (cytidine1402-2'-O)-methyltransferase